MGEKKRTILTPAQRVAKAEAELAEIKAKAEEADRKALVKLTEQRDKITARIIKDGDKLAEVQEEIDEILARLPEETLVVTEAEAEVVPEGMTV